MDNDYKKELGLLKKFVAEKNWSGLVSRYPLRDSNAFPQIAEKVLCKDVQDYEHLLISRVLESKSLADKFRQKLGGLSEKLMGKK